MSVPNQNEIESKEVLFSVNGRECGECGKSLVYLIDAGVTVVLCTNCQTRTAFAIQHFGNLSDLKHFMQLQNANSLKKGFTPPADELERHLLLIGGELHEAHEELRSGHAEDEVYYRESDGKPEGFPMELADTFIRICHVMGDLERKYPGLDMTKVILEKFEFNKSRPFKHGRQF